MGEDIKSRLQIFIRSLNISERDFCQSINVSHSYVQNMGSKINQATRNKIIAAYPLLSIDWLLTGLGNMLLEQPAASVPLPEEKKASPVGPPANNDMALRLLALVENLREDLAAKDRIIADNASAIKRLSEEVAAYRLKFEALKEEADASPSFRAVPSPAGSLV